MTASRRSSKRRSGRLPYIAGMRGRNRVRVYDRGSRGIYVDYVDASGKRVREALHTSDPDKAIAYAEQLASRILQTESRPSRRVTLEKLFDMYEREVSVSKSPSKCAHDRRTHRMLIDMLGADREPHTLSRRDFDRFVTLRRRGEVRPRGAQKRAVGDRVIEYDAKHINAVLNWATVAGNERGEPLLERNPFKGFPIPSERNPRRPVLTDAEYELALGVASQVHPLMHTLLVVAWETGHRIGSIRQLRWADVDFERRLITWRADADKEGRTHVTPMSENAARELTALRIAQGFQRGTWVFPSPTDASAACSRHFTRDLWERAAALAGLPAGVRLGWHSMRRAFASGLRDESPSELAHLGGWKSYGPVVQNYIRPDPEAQREAMGRRRPVLLDVSRQEGLKSAG